MVMPTVAPTPATVPEPHDHAAPGRDARYHVVLWNDPVTLMVVVVRILRRVFGYGRDRAERLMMTAHREGKVVVWTGPRDEATRHCLELGAHGLQSTVAPAG